MNASLVTETSYDKQSFLYLSIQCCLYSHIVSLLKSAFWPHISKHTPTKPLMHCDDSAKQPVKCLSFLLGFTSLLRKERKAELLFRPDVMFVVQYLHTVSPESNKPRGELLLQVEVDIVNEAAADDRHAADQDVERDAHQQPGRSWRRRALLAAAVVGGTALGALAAASGGRRGRR